MQSNLSLPSGEWNGLHLLEDDSSSKENGFEQKLGGSNTPAQ